MRINIQKTKKIAKQTEALIDFKVTSEDYYSTDKTFLRVNEYESIPPEYYVDKNDYIKFQELLITPMRDWIDKINKENLSLEKLIAENKYFTIDKLFTYLNIFKHKPIMKPFLWSSPKFNELLKDYLYTLIFNEEVNCLSVMPLRRKMKNSMTASCSLLEQNIITNFVEHILSTSNPLYFLSVVFAELMFTTEGIDLQIFDNDFQCSARTLSIPADIKSYQTLQQILNEGKLTIKATDTNFIIIENPAILTSKKFGKQETHKPISSDLHNFRTDKKIILLGGDYTLCSVIIYVSRGHYITLSNIGEFDDERVELGTEALDKFCENSKYNGNPGYLWFYQLTSYDPSGLKSRMENPVRSNQEILCLSASSGTHGHSSSSRSSAQLDRQQFSFSSRPSVESHTESRQSSVPSSATGDMHPLYLVKYAGQNEKFKSSTSYYTQCTVLDFLRWRFPSAEIDITKDPSKGLTLSAEERQTLPGFLRAFKEWQQKEEKTRVQGKSKYKQKYLKYKQKYLKLKNM